MAVSYSSTSPQVKHHVFLSFRGEDTRYNFTSHLHEALQGKMIATFIDNELEKGDGISPSLLREIEVSKISVIIFSKGYASSRWCLAELEKILECKNLYGQIVIPVFYHVDPSHVRHQTGTFGSGFAKLEDPFKERLEMLQRWRTALTVAADLSGWTLEAKTPEAQVVKEIVDDILTKLGNVLSQSSNKNLVGVESSIGEIESLLSNDDISTIGIWGNGGIGKTTIARAVFNKISWQFQKQYFAENIREESEKPGGLIRLQNDLLSTVLKDKHPNIDCSITKERIGLMKILIVFDDVTSLHQIEGLIDLKSLGVGSRIMITTRDKQVLNNCRVDYLYEVKRLSHPDDLHLFSQYAFKLNIIPEDYRELSKKIVNYADGFPLALKVLGSSLLDKGKEVWKSKIKKLEKGPPLDVQKVLKVSYNGLDEDEKNIFLDIVCFFKWSDIDSVIKFLDACDFSANVGISVLIDKCLINESSGIITMHDLIEEMGKKIVQEESMNDPGRLNRLWRYKDVHDVLTRNLGTNAIQGIRVDIFEMEETNLDSDAFTKMTQLRLLDFCCSCGIPGSDFQLEYDSPRHCTCKRANSKVHTTDQGIEFDFTNIRYFRWHQYPARSLQSKFHASNLVAVIMPHSKLLQFWNGTQHLGNLKYLNLSHSKDLTQILDLARAPNLENLNLKGCTSLIEISSSTQYLNKLVILNLKGCKSLSSLPSNNHSKSLKEVILSGCSNMKTAPMFKLPSSLVKLDLKNCSGLESLPSDLCRMKSLSYLDISGCSKLERLPDDLGDLKHLEDLKLRYLSFQSCKSFVLPTLSGLCSLRYLDLTGCHILKLTDSLGQLCSLEKLNLSKNSFESMPTSIKDLTNLKLLDVSGCKRLQCLPELPNSCLVTRAYGCMSLEEVSDISYLFSPVTIRYAQRELILANCFKLNQNALSNRVKDGVLRIQQSGDELYRKRSYKKHRSSHGCIFFAGNEIPEWFKCQTRGSSMFIKLLPDWSNKNFLGFALCAVVQFPDHIAIRHLNVSFSCKIKNKDGDENEHHYASFHANFPIHNNEPLAIQQDHVLLGFTLPAHKHVRIPLSDEDVDLSDNSNGYIKFVAYGRRLHENNKIVNLEVKNCGIHLLYAHDDGTPMEEQEERESQAKRLKYLRAD